MKAISEVNRSFFEMVRGSSRFNDSAVLIINSNTVKTDNLLVKTEYNWRGAKIDVTLPIDVLEIINHILENVEFVSLYPMREIALNMPEEELIKFLLGVLSATPNLQYLQLDLNFMDKILHDVFSSPAVQANLKNLAVLDILEWRFEKGGFKVPWRSSACGNFEDWGGGDDDGEDGAFARNFLQLSELPMRLECLRIAKINPISVESEKCMKFVPAMLRNNRETLSELSLHSRLWEMEEMKAIMLPNLKRLEVSITPSGQEVLCVFLTNHPLLEELNVAVSKEFGRSLLAAIQGRSSKLKKLHIKAKTFAGFGDEGGRVDWSFLGGMAELKDFTIAHPHNPETNFESYGTGPQFLECLPQEQLHHLSFKGIGHSLLGFWRTRNGLLAEDEHGNMVSSELGLDMKKDLLRGFQNLRSLSFIRCPEAVDDKVIQFICREMTKLERLEITHSKFLTDNGLNGRPAVEGENPVTIQNLKCKLVLMI